MAEDGWFWLGRSAAATVPSGKSLERRMQTAYGGSAVKAEQLSENVSEYEEHLNMGALWDVCRASVEIHLYC